MEGLAKWKLAMDGVYAHGSTNLVNMAVQDIVRAYALS